MKKWLVGAIVVTGIFMSLTLARYWKHAFYRKAVEYKRRIKEAELDMIKQRKKLVRLPTQGGGMISRS